MSLEKISPELFEKLVGLASLELKPEEREYLLTEMNHQLASVFELTQIPLEDDLAPSLHGILCSGPEPRKDEAKAFPHPEQILAQAPENEAGMFAVPDVAKGAK